MKNVKSGDNLIHKEGYHEEFGYEIAFSVEPLKKLLVDPIKDYEKKKFVSTYLQPNQRFYLVYANEEGFTSKEMF